MRNEKRKDIQGLRAVAILMVLLFHFYPKYCPNGYVGVDIFFVISGFLMCMILSKHNSITAAVVKDFYTKRTKRIFPLYYVAILFILTILVTILPELFAQTNRKFAFKAMFLTTNIKESNQDNYQLEMAGARNLFTHTWSLCVELQFYLMVPFIMLTAKYLKNKASPEIVYLYYGSTSFVLFYMLPPDMAFNSVIARMWQFMCGFLAFEFSKKPEILQIEKLGLLAEEEQKDDDEVPLIHKSASIAFDRLGLKYISMISLFIGLLWFVIDPRVIRITCTVATALIIQQGSYEQLKPLTHSTLYYIGEASYSIYLFHWPIYITAKTMLDADGLTARIAGMEIALLVSVVVGFAVHLLFEKQYLKWSTLLTFSFVVLVFIVCIILTMFIVQVKQVVENPKRMNISAVFEEAIKWNEKNAFDNEGIPTLYPNNSGCVYDYYKEDKDEKRWATCPKGEGKLKFLVIGNSYAANHLDSVYKYFKKYASDFWGYYNPGCDVLIDNQSGYCPRNWKWTFMDVTKDLKPDVVFMIVRIMNSDNVTEVNVVEDPFYKKCLDRLTSYEDLPFVKRVYIFNGMPCFITYVVSYANKYLREGMMLKDAPNLVWHNEEQMRIRYDQLQKVCKKCKVYDAVPRFTNKYTTMNETFMAFDETNNHMYFSNPQHFTRLGLQRLERVYEDLEVDFEENVLDKQ